MDNQVIHIYGASGSGTSTLGRFICTQLGYFFMDTDNYFWEPADPPYTSKRNISDRLALMRRDMEKHGNVVIAGSLVDWGDELIPRFTLAVRLETDTELRIDRLRRRERAHFGNRINPGGDMYENHREFITWAASYDGGGLDMRSKSKHDEWQKQLECPRLLLDGSLPVEKNFELVMKHL